MEIVRISKDNLSYFQAMYVEFFKELRGKQGWNASDEEAYRKEAEDYFGRGDIIFLTLEDEQAAGFIRLSSRVELLDRGTLR
ncbi:MAG: hypothetical protein PWQ79_1115 [Thermococcaceae archaeon]|nr:hypothetical protein [Thermococcaceae archaeon]